ncbi:hypothetical protein GCM10010232_17350 [Streptomyces amakusaensis]
MDEKGGQQGADLRLGDVDLFAGRRGDGEGAQHGEVHDRTVAVRGRQRSDRGPTARLGKVEPAEENGSYEKSREVRE